MIGRLSGRLGAKQPPQVLVDVGGVAYELDVPMSTFYGLPATGEAVSLYTHLVVREDAHTLYGFAHAGRAHCVPPADPHLGRRRAHRARRALRAFGERSRPRGDAAGCGAAHPRVPGIGKKTAERLLLELKGKLAEASRRGRRPARLGRA